MLFLLELPLLFYVFCSAFVIVSSNHGGFSRTCLFLLILVLINREFPSWCFYLLIYYLFYISVIPFIEAHTRSAVEQFKSYCLVIRVATRFLIQWMNEYIYAKFTTNLLFVIEIRKRIYSYNTEIELKPSSGQTTHFFHP